MKWLTKICKVLENPKYRNMRVSWTSQNQKGKFIAACALGELLLTSKCKKQYHETTGDTIRRSLTSYYKVPERLMEQIFVKINDLNANGKTKQQIAKILKKEYK